MINDLVPELFNAYLFLQSQIGVIKAIGFDVPKKLLFMQDENQKHLFHL